MYRMNIDVKLMQIIFQKGTDVSRALTRMKKLIVVTLNKPDGFIMTLMTTKWIFIIKILIKNIVIDIHLSLYEFSSTSIL